MYQSRITMDRKFTIIDEITNTYRRFNTIRNQLNVRLLPPLNEEERDPISYFIDSVTNLCEHALRNCDVSDMVGISNRKEDNMRHQVIGISFRRKDQIWADVILKVWEMVTQFKSRFNALDKLILEVHSLKIPVGFGRVMKTNGRQLDTFAHLKKAL